MSKRSPDERKRYPGPYPPTPACRCCSCGLPAAIVARMGDLLHCPVPFAKRFRLSRRANHFYSFARLAPERDVGHRHERWARDAMDALARKTSACKADGEVAWS